MAPDFHEVQATGEDFETRIDELLASAIEDQARDQRLLFESVQAAQIETAKLRVLIESRDQGLADLVETRLSGVATHESIEKISTALGERLDAVRAVLDRLDPWKPAMEVQRTLATRLADGIASISEKVSESAAALGAGLADSSNELGALVQANGARSFDRLMQVQEELTRMAALLEGLPRSLVEKVNNDLNRFRAAMQETLGDHSAEVSQKLDENLASGRQALAAVSRQMEGLRSTVDSQAPNLAEEVSGAMEPFGEELRRLAARVRRTNMNGAELGARLEAMHTSLVAYLAERDERLERVRDQALAEVIESIAEGLKRRDRIHIGESLRRAEQARKDRRDAERYRKLKAKGTANGLAESPPDFPPVAPAAKKLPARRSNGSKAKTPPPAGNRIPARKAHRKPAV